MWAATAADTMVVRVLDALEKSPHAGNTIVVLWSDNGYHLGEKFAWAKHTLWERTSNVPFIWAGPGVAQGAVVDTTVSLLDTRRSCRTTGKQKERGDLAGVNSERPIKCQRSHSVADSRPGAVQPDQPEVALHLPGARRRTALRSDQRPTRAPQPCAGRRPDRPNERLPFATPKRVRPSGDGNQSTQPTTTILRRNVRMAHVDTAVHEEAKEVTGADFR